ncbi:non-specific lipid transfer protein GPI-anchored 7-like [Gastrolobium bilobum]|uniref:non-specific lipid transfer protein GPI-anchored 7-like n=1 Tax=Gastrolobium bilobum TaxID=150636 RepID=UPI002AB105FA|nr:non-specific lipid transfer protein GPI-anchored 7-like [Gastrolobium bilobum]
MGGWSMSLMVGLVFMMSAMSLTEAQSGGTNTTCASDLIPYANYLTTPNPPASCCNPLKQTVATQLPCLCNIFFTPGLLQGFNISVDQALQLSRCCGVTSDLSSCKQGTLTLRGYARNMVIRQCDYLDR